MSTKLTRHVPKIGKSQVAISPLLAGPIISKRSLRGSNCEVAASRAVFGCFHATDTHLLWYSSTQFFNLISYLDFLGSLEFLLFQARVRETFELNQLKSVPSQLLPVFSGFDQLQTCCPFIWTGQYSIFFSSAGKFLLHYNDNQPRTWALICKLVFQCSKIMKCNNEAKVTHVCLSPNRYKPTKGRLPKP